MKPTPLHRVRVRLMSHLMRLQLLVAASSLAASSLASFVWTEPYIDSAIWTVPCSCCMGGPTCCMMACSTNSPKCRTKRGVETPCVDESACRWTHEVDDEHWFVC